MKKKFIIIIVVSVIMNIILLSLLISNDIKSKKTEGNITFWSINYTIHQLNDLISAYESGQLTSESLKECYQDLHNIDGIIHYSKVFDDVIPPIGFIFNRSFDDLNNETINGYKELMLFLESYLEVLREMDGDSRLNAYDLFSSDKFNKELKILIDAAND